MTNEFNCHLITIVIGSRDLNGAASYINNRDFTILKDRIAFVNSWQV